MLLLSDVQPVANTMLLRTIKVWCRANAAHLQLFAFQPVSQLGCAVHVHD